MVNGSICVCGVLCLAGVGGGGDVSLRMIFKVFEAIVTVVIM